MKSVPLARCCVLVLLMSCLYLTTQTHDSGGDELPVDGLAQLAGCADLESPFLSVTLVDTEMPTVPRLDWESEETLTPRLVLDTGAEDLIEVMGEAEADTSGQMLVFGTPALQTGRAMLVVDTEDGRACSEAFEFQTGVLSTKLPEITLSEVDLTRAEGGYTLIDLLTEAGSFVTIVDEHGQYIWANHVGIIGVARVVAGLDRRSVLYLKWSDGADGLGAITRMGLDGSVQSIVEVQGIHADFVELPDGSFGALAWEVREFVDGDGETRRLVGDRLIRVGQDGTVEDLWSSFDAFEVDLSKTYPIDGYGGANVEDWSHGNGLHYDPEVDAFFITLSGLKSVVRIEAETGVQSWWLTGGGGDFVSTNGDRSVVHGPHSVEHLGDDRLLLFNRNLSVDEDLSDDTDVCSEAVELQLDQDAGTVEETWSYSSEDCLWVLFFGEARRLENGNTMVIFSSAGQIDETSPEGETVWRINTDVGGAFGFGDRVSGFRLD